LRDRNMPLRRWWKVVLPSETKGLSRLPQTRGQYSRPRVLDILREYPIVPPCCHDRTGLTSIASAAANPELHHPTLVPCISYNPPLQRYKSPDASRYTELHSREGVATRTKRQATVKGAIRYNAIRRGLGRDHRALCEQPVSGACRKEYRRRRRQSAAKVLPCLDHLGAN